MKKHKPIQALSLPPFAADNYCERVLGAHLVPLKLYGYRYTKPKGRKFQKMRTRIINRVLGFTEPQPKRKVFVVRTERPDIEALRQVFFGG